MDLFRIVFLAGAILVTGGAGYLSWHGIGRESADLDRSIREGSAGNLVTSRVK